MRRSSIAIFISLLSIISLFGSDSNSVIPEIFQKIIKQLSEKNHFDPTKLKSVEASYDVRSKMTKDFVFHQISPPEGSADMFTDEICYNTISNEFWVYRTGGFAGVAILYGSGNLIKD